MADVTTGDFEVWFLEVVRIHDEKMRIIIDVFNASEWVASYWLGLTPMDAVKERYGLT